MILHIFRSPLVIPDPTPDCRTPDKVCRCGHDYCCHEHNRAGWDCGRCPCASFRRARRVATPEQAAAHRAHVLNLMRTLTPDPDPCQGPGECATWDARGDRPVPVFCQHHCPDCRNPFVECLAHRPLSYDELGQMIVNGAARHRRRI